MFSLFQDFIFAWQHRIRKNRVDDGDVEMMFDVITVCYTHIFRGFEWILEVYSCLFYFVMSGTSLRFHVLI